MWPGRGLRRVMMRWSYLFLSLRGSLNFAGSSENPGAKRPRLEVAFGTAEPVPFQGDFPALKALANKYPPLVNVPDTPANHDHSVLALVNLLVSRSWNGIPGPLGCPGGRRGARRVC